PDYGEVSLDALHVNRSGIRDGMNSFARWRFAPSVLRTRFLASFQASEGGIFLPVVEYWAIFDRYPPHHLLIEERTRMSISHPLKAVHRHGRAFRVLLILTLWLLATLSALAQPITSETKEKVLKGMQDYLTQRAYVPGVDFEKWPAFLAKHQEGID